MNLKKLKAKLAKPDVVPAGWKTSNGFAAEWGLSREQSGALLRAALRQKLSEQRKFRIVVGDCVRPVMHTRFIE